MHYPNKTPPARVLELLTKHDRTTLLLHLSFRAAHKFLAAGPENREIAAYVAYRCKEPWAYSFPLQETCAYLKQKAYLKDCLMTQIASLSDREVNLLKEQCSSLHEKVPC